MTFTIKMDAFWVMLALITLLLAESNAAYTLCWLFMIGFWTTWLVIDVGDEIKRRDAQQFIRIGDAK